MRETRDRAKEEREWMKEHYNPEGPEYFGTSGRHYKFCTEGHAVGWVLYKHPDGQWVTLRKMTDLELEENGLEKKGPQ